MVSDKIKEDVVLVYMYTISMQELRCNLQAAFTPPLTVKQIDI